MAIARAQDDENTQQSLIERATSWPVRMRDYVAELQLEMRRVSWPNWKQVRATTTIVIISVFMFAAYFYVVDLICNGIVQKIYNALTR